MAGFRAFAGSPHLPIWPFERAKLPKVSGLCEKYSRFQETMAGDLVRSLLPPEVGSAKKARVNSGVIRLGGAYSGHSTGQLISGREIAECLK